MKHNYKLVSLFTLTACIHYSLIEQDSSTESYPEEEYMNPERISHSITQGTLKANAKNLDSILHKEFEDVSLELGNKIATTITNTIDNLRDEQIDRNKFKEVIVIQKRILTDGKRKVVNMNISGRVVPKPSGVNEEISRDLGVRALLGGILFLLAGLLFTSTVKIYQGWIKKKYLKVGVKKISN